MNKTKMARVPANNVKAVLDHCNGNLVQAALRMGVYPSTIGRAIRINECTTRIDLLARGALDQLAREWNETKAEAQAKSDVVVEHYFDNTQTPEPILYGVMVPPTKQTSFEKLLTLMGLESVVI